MGGCVLLLMRVERGGRRRRKLWRKVFDDYVLYLRPHHKPAHGCRLLFTMASSSTTTDPLTQVEELKCQGNDAFRKVSRSLFSFSSAYFCLFALLCKKKCCVIFHFVPTYVHLACPSFCFDTSNTLYGLIAGRYPECY